ncbi:hypothetical protein PsorP6_007252 [Peronosclerospora sorghi]|uniref:Uncharacterized protein n=1 Tax=Peronosclerospora sorghi TaxID=230839 RepID=A0ACC0W833_9STRA|nr:hypothetical protein PsorP6_007252 [Peronosclerospora sorghi]
MVNFLELFLLAVLLGVPCAIIFLKSAANPSLFVLHPALNAIAFLLCFPLGIYVMQERKSVMDFKTRFYPSCTCFFKYHWYSLGLADTFGGKKTTWQWKNSGHRIGGILAFSSGVRFVGHLSIGRDFAVHCCLLGIRCVFFVNCGDSDGETSHHPVHQERLKDLVYGFGHLSHHAGIVFKEYFGSGYRH